MKTIRKATCLLLIGASLTFPVTHSNLTIKKFASNKDGFSVIQVETQAGMDACNESLFYFSDKSLQATIMTVVSLGKPIRKMQWTNAGTSINFGGDLTSCRVDYVDFDP